ncbi:MAG: tetratricopeptide repeat protein [Blastocatellia bacterium]|nr:tetratricopeptide repeat protein [Blastocatellia bacterium]
MFVPRPQTFSTRNFLIWWLFLILLLSADWTFAQELPLAERCSTGSATVPLPTYEEAETLVRRPSVSPQPTATTIETVLDQRFQSALTYKKEGNLTQAAALLTELVATQEADTDPLHPGLVPALTALSDVYRLQGNYAQAETTALRLEAVLDTHLTALAPETQAAARNIIAMVAFAQGHFGQAEQGFSISIRLLERVIGGNHPDLALRLNNLAECHKACGRMEAAKPLFRRALRLLEANPAANPTALAAVLNNLAGLYRFEGRIHEAQSYYKRALYLWERTLGSEHPTVAAALNNLADLSAFTGNPAEATRLVQQAQQILEKKYGRIHPEVAKTYATLGAIAFAGKNYKMAQLHYEQALHIEQQLFAAAHPMTAMTLNNLAVVERIQGQFAEAEAHQKTALEIWEKTVGRTHPEYVAGLKNLACLLHQEGKKTQAGAVELQLRNAVPRQAAPPFERWVIDARTRR